MSKHRGFTHCKCWWEDGKHLATAGTSTFVAKRTLSIFVPPAEALVCHILARKNPAILSGALLPTAGVMVCWLAKMTKVGPDDTVSSGES